MPPSRAPPRYGEPLLSIPSSTVAVGLSTDEWADHGSGARHCQVDDADPDRSHAECREFKWRLGIDDTDGATAKGDEPQAEPDTLVRHELEGTGETLRGSLRWIRHPHRDHCEDRQRQGNGTEDPDGTDQ